MTLEETKAAFKEIVKVAEKMDSLNIPLNDNPGAYTENDVPYQHAVMRQYINSRIAELREALLK